MLTKCFTLATEQANCNTISTTRRTLGGAQCERYKLSYSACRQSVCLPVRIHWHRSSCCCCFCCFYSSCHTIIIHDIAYLLGRQIKNIYVQKIKEKTENTKTENQKLKMLTYSRQNIAQLFKFTEAHSLSHRIFSAALMSTPDEVHAHFAIECVWMYRIESASSASISIDLTRECYIN